ncbi:Predicted oxidoreductase [Atopostipes suicloacalis DSM 15692]|uniref:Predicted oxidoreductase n=1 Tax=Atopostipes suicloacalis DSM 15692 TaxID=1121025 RepID=A0A1M4T1H6_9LACT|nr:aldo/keto reductase [Atopostipes suicloacalis]SHE38333.1 Predicted oxidoreductase [Atopostipes suicloacalis DSM 15692]
MKKVRFGTSNEKVAAVGLGLMRIQTADNPVEVLNTAYENQIDFFDHADIYGQGQSETIFADALEKSVVKREDIFIQSKCGIVPGEMYDFSKEHIVQAVEGSLQRLKMDYLDSLLLHRPDTLMEPEEVAEAFNKLEREGKVRHFGVSNFTPGHVELLKTAVNQPLQANQLQFGLLHTGMVDQGIHANRNEKASIDHDGGILEYSRIHKMTIQAWSPYQGPGDTGVFIDNDLFPELNTLLKELADKYETTPTGISSAWILRHPADMQVIIGSMNLNRIEQIAKASNIQISRKDWYALYMAAGNGLP